MFFSTSFMACCTILAPTSGFSMPNDVMAAIINIIAYVCSALVVDDLDVYCTLAGSNQLNVPCYMIMKNEFLFNCALLTNSRKNYADTQALQEGNIIPDNQKARMAIMGLTIYSPLIMVTWCL